MESNRSNYNFTKGDKSTPIVQSTPITNGAVNGATGSNSSLVLGSETEPSSAEPPKPSVNSNYNDRDDKNSVEKYTDSVLSNNQNNRVLSDEQKSVSVLASSPTLNSSHKFINNNNNGNNTNTITDNSNNNEQSACNGAMNSRYIDTDGDMKQVAVAFVDSTTTKNDNTAVHTNDSHTNRSDIDNDTNNCVAVSSIQNKGDQSISQSDSAKSALVSSSSNLNSDDRVSSDTISSDSIDVTTKCPADNYQTKVCSVHSKGTSAMDDESSLRIPLLGNNSENNGTDYNAIDKPTKLRSTTTTTTLSQTNVSAVNDLDSASKRVLYNDYVNLLCDTDLSGAVAAAGKQESNVNANESEERDENRPLLQQNSSYLSKRKQIQKPKSIVKSTSTQSFGASNENSVNVNRKPRLSIQCNKSDSERVCHVQFFSKSKNDDSDLVKSNNDRSYSNNLGVTKYFRSSISSTSSTSSSSTDSSSSDDASSLDQFAEAKPPDGGWGWVVVFASFMVNLIADGITFSFGVMFVELLKSFGEGKAKTAWIGSLFMAIPLLSGPIASFLTDRYGCRKVTIVGSILAAIGFIISSFSNSILMLCFTFGIFAGFGLSLCYVAAVVIVAYYFDKRRSFATGLSVCGSGIGTFLFAPLMQYLLDEYGWRGTTLILAGMFLNITVCGMLMRDLEWTTYKSKQKAKLRRKRNQLAISAESFSVSNSSNTGGTSSNLHKDESNGNGFDHSDPNGDNSISNHSKNSERNPRLFSSLIALPTFVKNGEKVPVEVLELLSKNKNVDNMLMKNYPELEHSRSFSQPLTIGRQPNPSILAAENNALSPIEPIPEIGDNNEDDDTVGDVVVSNYNKSKSRRIRNEQAFLTWIKQDPNVHGPKDVRIMMQQQQQQQHRQHPPTAYLKDLRMHRHSLTYRGAMLNINRYRLRASSCPDIYRNSMTTIAKEKSQWGQGIDEFKGVLIDMLDFSFFSDIRFTLFAISNFLLYAWYDVPYVYLADNAGKMGFDETEASYLISLIGIVNMFGEIILGWLGDRKFITAGMIYAICMLFCGLVTGLVPLITSYVGLSVLSGLFGMFIAANYALTSIILVELITLDRFTNAYGLLLLVQGIANLIGPPLAGWISDLNDNYDYAFYFAGVFIAISGLLMLILPARGKIKKYRRKKHLGNSEDDGDESDDEEDDEYNDIEKQIVAPKLDHQTIVAPKSVLKFNGNTSGLFGSKNLLNSQKDNTEINQV